VRATGTAVAESSQMRHCQIGDAACSLGVGVACSSIVGGVPNHAMDVGTLGSSSQPLRLLVECCVSRPG